MVKEKLLPLMVQVGVISPKRAVEGELHRLEKYSLPFHNGTCPRGTIAISTHQGRVCAERHADWLGHHARPPSRERRPPRGQERWSCGSGRGPSVDAVLPRQSERWGRERRQSRSRFATRSRESPSLAPRRT